MTEIIKIEEERLCVIKDLAHTIWPVVYQEMLSPEQLRFMLDNIYTLSALTEALHEGENFYIYQVEGKVIGFTSIKEKSEVMRLEKLYVLPENHHRGVGAALLSFVEQEARNRGFDIVELNVNRRNSACSFYLKKGFEIYQEIDIPYYSFVLDDYIMRKRITVQD